MSFVVRPLNGTLGSGIAIADGLGKEKKLAVFADAWIEDFAFVGDTRCALISLKRGIALVDLIACTVIKRSRLRQPVDRIAVSRDGIRAVAYRCRPGLLTIVNPSTLEETGHYNLIRRRQDSDFELLHRDLDAFRESGDFWDSIPHSDSPLRDEIDDEFSLKHVKHEPSGLRRMLFTRSAKARFRADGKVVMPFEFSVNGPRWSWDRSSKKPLEASARDCSVGVAVIDLDEARLEMKVIRRQIEPGVYTAFPVKSISPDGSLAILSSFDPVVADSDRQDRQFGGWMRRLLRPEAKKDLALSLETWGIEGKPEIAGAVAFRRLNGETLLPTDTQRFGDAERAEARGQIELVFPGVEAGFKGAAREWRESQQKQREDAYFDPLETRKFPAFIADFTRVHYPPLFAETAQRLVKLNPCPFSKLPWKDLDDRQRQFVAAVLYAWGQHSGHACDSTVWIDDERLVVLSRDGVIREISVASGIGPAYQLIDAGTGAWPFSEPRVRPLELTHLRGRGFAVELPALRLEFDLPSGGEFGRDDLGGSTPLTYRVAMDAKSHDAEVKQVDRLAEAIRRGYVRITSKQPIHVVAGLRELAREVRDHLDEVVVDDRWLPSLYYRGKPVTEAEFCEILVADGSDEAANALDGLLTAFLDVSEKKLQNVWHPDDITPAMGPVAFALIRMRDPLPPAIARFYAVRDMHHDNWTPQAFQRLALSRQRLISSDLMTLQIRLAIQDIGVGHAKANIFALYRLPLVRAALHADPSLAFELAVAIVGQLEAQASDADGTPGAFGAGVLEAITKGLDANAPAETSLAAELGRLAALRQVR